MRTRRANSQEMTYDQVQDRKDRGVEGLRRLGNDSAASALQGETVEDFAERKGIVLVNPRRKSGDRVIGRSGDRGKRGRRNPDTEADAAALYERFTGRKPKGIREIQIEQRDWHNLTSLGTLDYLITDLTHELWGNGVPLEELAQKKSATGAGAISFQENDGIALASNPDGTQLYFVGGKQDIIKGFGGVLDLSKDFIDLGECWYVSYIAQKDFDNFQETYYCHRLGEGGKQRPRLMFNQLDCQLYLIGGEYKVKREGIVN